MQNRFGFKDFVILAVVFIVGVLVALQMQQTDRAWARIGDIQAKMTEIEKQFASGGNDDLRREISELKTAIANRPININLGGVSSRDVSVGTDDPMVPDGTNAEAATAMDESWARPGVKIARRESTGFTSDPEAVPGFKDGGEFTEIFGARMPRITPYLSGDVYSRRVLDQVVEPLGSYDPETLQIKGVLADAWQFDPDGMWLRVHLDPRAIFSDGMPVTAEDVRWTVEDFIKNTRIEAERSRSTLDMIEAVKVIDDRTVEFVFNKAVFTNLDYTLGIYVLPKHVYAPLEESVINQSTGILVGSGPFRLEVMDVDNQWSPGEDVVIVRNERYWGAEKPALESMRFKVITEPTAALVGFRNGDGDMLTPSSTQYSKLRKDGDFLQNNAIYKWVNMRSGYSFIGWQCGRRGGPPDGRWTPFHDQRVRRAMTMILDREQMIRSIWAGVGVVSTGPNSPSSPSSNPDISPWPYDPAAAKALLAEAGWADADGDGILEYQRDDEFFSKGMPFKFEFTITNSGETSERIISYLVSQCGESGIICEPRVVDWSFYSDMLKRRDFDAMIMAWSASSPESDPKQIWHRLSILDQGDNFIQWDSPAASDLIDKGRAAMDRDERMLVWHDFHSVIHEEQPYTFLRVSPWIRFINREIGNVQTYPIGLETGEFFRVAE
jgi:peptide/nickel transport system substrate-binding protein